jgi:phytoene dehydrogenase-like protein
MRAVFREDDARSLVAGLAAHAMLDLREPVTGGIALFLAGLAHGVGWPVAVGGSERIADALVARLARHGGEIRTGERVRSLAQLPSARAVLLDLTPRQVLHVAGDALPPRYAARLARWRYGSGVFKLDWALDGPIPWRDPALAAVGTVHLGGPGSEVVASERAVARGAVPDVPYVLLVQATVADASRAPVGKHTAWAYCHVPHGADIDRTKAIEDRIEAFAPGFRDRILARHSMGPAALEAHDANEIGGDIGGGVTDWRQLLARPIPSPTPWATPVPRLFLCSASTLPGGGAHGMAGWNAARLALARGGARVPARRVATA